MEISRGATPPEKAQQNIPPREWRRIFNRKEHKGRKVFNHR